jgi:DNA invertase Pin-like site-specific DNA recombinase
MVPLLTLDSNILEKIIKCKSSLKNDSNNEKIIPKIPPKTRELKKRVRYLTKEEKDFAHKEYESGKNFTEISKELDCHRITIGRLINAKK